MNTRALLHHNSGGAVFFLDGVPLPFVLQRRNVQRGLPTAPKLKRNAEGDRAKAKAKGRAFAAAEHAEQKDWEQHFKAALNWSWRKVEQELRARGLTFSRLRDLANVTSLVPA